MHSTKLLLACLVAAAAAASEENVQRFLPDWNSLDTRVAPVWYDEAKVGIFIHWGVFAVPSYVSEWFWWYWQGDGSPTNPYVKDYVKANYPPGWTYADFGRDFTTEFFNATEWASLFRDSGAKYVVLTTKHHEGFTMWPSATSFNWNAMDVGPRRDLVGELAKAVRAAGVRYGVYHSLFEWFNPLFLADKNNNFTTNEYSLHKAQSELYDLVQRYEPSVIWSDGDPAPDWYWNSTNFLAWLYNDSPVKDEVVVNDRWGDGTSCKHGDFYNCADRYNPGHTLPHKWENAFTLDTSSWGYRRTMTIDSVMTIQDVLNNVVSTVACNGNVLINIGPRKDGTIPVIFQERLRQLGQWLKTNGEAIYSTKPWKNSHDGLNEKVWFTQNGNTIYAHMTSWTGNELELTYLNTTIVPEISKIQMLGTDAGDLKFTIDGTSTRISLPVLSPEDDAKWVWVLKIETN